MNFLNARWTDDEETMIRAERADGQVVFIPPDPCNADYRTLLEGQEGSPPAAIAPATGAEPD